MVASAGAERERASDNALRQRLLLGVAAVFALGLPACTAGMNICPCDVCPSEQAIELSVVEEGSEAPIDDFLVEVIQDGVPQGEPDNCSETFREGNSCAFGDSVGLYQVIVQAPGYEQREASARVAAEAESELCCRACLSGKLLEVALTPLPFEG